MGSMFHFYQRAKSYYENTMQREKLSRLEELINAAAIKIATQVESVCPYGFVDCPNTTLYPVFNGPIITWNFDNGFADVVNMLRSKSPCLILPNWTVNSIRFDCTNIGVVNFVYIDAANNRRTDIMDNNPRRFNYLIDWNIAVEYNETGVNNRVIQRRITTGNHYLISLAESYNELGKRTLDKMRMLRDLLKNYGTQKRFMELNSRPDPQTGIGGMYETDDFSIPWVWQILSPDQRFVFYVCRDTACSQFCQRNANGTVNTASCSPVSSVWENSNFTNITSSSRTAFTRIQNNLSVNSNISTDGFGNSLYIALIGNGNCTLTNCPSNNPPAPSRNYPLQPPYITVIGTFFCFANQSARYGCSMSFTYPQ